MTDEQVLDNNIENLLSAIHICLKKELILPALVLIYSGIDIMASLSRPESHNSVTREDFINWTDKYLLPESTLSCKAKDIYAARCGIIHSYTAEANLTRNGLAKMLFYSYGKADSKKLQKRLEQLNITEAIAIDVNSLFVSFCNAIERFGNSLLSDRDLEKLVYTRARKFFKFANSAALNHL